VGEFVGYSPKSKKQLIFQWSSILIERHQALSRCDCKTFCRQTPRKAGTSDAIVKQELRLAITKRRNCPQTVINRTALPNALSDGYFARSLRVGPLFRQTAGDRWSISSPLLIERAA
jgi:hypothetical protein